VHHSLPVFFFYHRILNSSYPWLSPVPHIRFRRPPAFPTLSVISSSWSPPPKLHFWSWRVFVFLLEPQGGRSIFSSQS